MIGERARGAIPAAHFLAMPEVAGLNAALVAEGFEAAVSCRPQWRGRHLRVGLIWRRGEAGEHCVLRLRLRLPLEMADG